MVIVKIERPQTLASPAQVVEQLIAAAFNPATGRLLRSAEYKAGVRAQLLRRLIQKPLACPYAKGTAAADAFFAGAEEGSTIWAQHVFDQFKSDPQAAQAHFNAAATLAASRGWLEHAL